MSSFKVRNKKITYNFMYFNSYFVHIVNYLQYTTNLFIYAYK